ncbi:zinc ribbon domain-containing protein [Halomicrococcus sp. NG-SE-24]|uniref:zinc ribbon domain-containing protein n=1 Tax=Halomicrococcus sp. NG-SE-24 TaxID=3436928 RepID=UPI003D9998DF
MGLQRATKILEWKAAEYGISVEPIPPAFTSQICSRCGHQSSTNQGPDGWFSCNECGYKLDGDYNAAKNISLKLLTVPEGKRRSELGTVSLP